MKIEIDDLFAFRCAMNIAAHLAAKETAGEYPFVSIETLTQLIQEEIKNTIWISAVVA